MRSEFKSILILTLFSYLMWDYLTIATVGFSSLGLLLIGLKIRVPKQIRTAVALAVFASYWFKYGKVIDPEVGLNFLTSVVILKLLEKESLRDSYMVFFGLILLLSAGALFEKSLTYVIFFASSFLILLLDFYGILLIKSRVRDLFVGLLWVVPLTCVLFFAVPRIMSPLAFKNSSPSAGEVGYTPNLRIADVEGLEMNSEPVFQALVDRSLSPGELYWRGNVLVQTDGWNWTRAYENNLLTPAEKIPPEMTGVIRQKVRMFAREPFLFALDHPEKFFFGAYTVLLDDQRMVSLQGDEYRPRYEVISRPKGISPDKEMSSGETAEKFKKVIMSKKTRSWIDETFPSRDLAGLRRDIQNYYQENGFTYTLRPGRITNFTEFMSSKRTGFCAHYASATALILRARGIPVRLVSGFLGGNYNSYASFYLVTQNDAHVWLEAFENGQWLRMDPTAWIAPERITLGGEAFLDAVAAGAPGALGRARVNFAWLREMSMWFNQWDFRFYQWLEEMDYYGQEAFLSRLKLKRKWLYTLVPLLIIFFVGLFVWQTRRREESAALSIHERAWKEFVEKVKSKGLELALVSVTDVEKKLAAWEHPESGKVRELWSELVGSSFSESDDDWKGLRKKIRRL